MLRRRTVLVSVLLVVALVWPVVAFGYINGGRRSKGANERSLAESRRIELSIAQRQRDAAERRAREYEQAVAAINAAIQRDPNDVVAVYRRGKFLQEHWEFDKAISDFNTVIKRDPKFARAYFRRSFLWTRRGEYARTLADLDEAIRLDPAFIASHFHRAVFLFVCPDWQWRNSKEAQRSAQTACDLAQKVRDPQDSRQLLSDRSQDTVQHQEYRQMLDAITAEIDRQMDAEFLLRAEYYLTTPIR